MKKIFKILALTLVLLLGIFVALFEYQEITRNRKANDSRLEFHIINNSKQNISNLRFKIYPVQDEVLVISDVSANSEITIRAAVPYRGGDSDMTMEFVDNSNGSHQSSAIGYLEAKNCPLSGSLEVVINPDLTTTIKENLNSNY